MFHFDMPAALDERGSWGNRDSIDWFLNFAKVMFENPRIKYWLTINEQNMLTLVGPVIGTLMIPEGCTNVLKENLPTKPPYVSSTSKSDGFMS